MIKRSSTYLNPEIYRTRREKLMQNLGPGLLVLGGANLTIRNSDVHHPFRQESDFYYLSRFEEPDSCLLISMEKSGKVTTTMVVPPRDIEREIWDGKRAGIEGALKDYGVDHAVSNAELADTLFRLMEGHDVLFHDFQRETRLDALVLATLKRWQSVRRKNPVYPRTIRSFRETLGDQRHIKSGLEIELFKECAEVSERAHHGVMQKLQPGMNECEIEALLQYEYKRNGGTWGYGHIVASGVNATCLHYNENNCEMKDGELLLIDSGCEMPHKFTSDITRCYPVGGKFAPLAKDVYTVVLKAQKEAIAACVVGSSIREVHVKTQLTLAKGLVELGIFSGNPQDLVENGSVAKFYMHGTSHWLGMDVHDVGRYDQANGEAWTFRPGMMLTVEPGLYFNPDFSKMTTKYDGIGVRIEDNILISENGPINLTAGIPKEIEEIEAIMEGGPIHEES